MRYEIHQAQGITSDYKTPYLSNWAQKYRSKQVEILHSLVASIQFSGNMIAYLWWFIKFQIWLFFIPCNKSLDVPIIENLFFQHVLTNCNLHYTIVSYQDSRFLSYFWKSLWKMLGCQWQFFTSFLKLMDRLRYWIKP